MANEKKAVETPVEYDPQYILQVKDLKKYFPIKGGMISKTVGHVKAVDGVTFNLKRGTTMGLVGESGCGKTTTGRTILRLAGEKTGGQVLFNGKDVYALSDKEMRDMRTKMQIIFQDPFSSLDPRWRVAKSVAEPLSLQRRDLNNTDIDERVAAALTMAGLEPADFLNRYPIDLSGGQAQRVVIARAIINEPKVILADEPMSAIDVAARIQILDTFAAIRAARPSTAIIMVSHDLGVVQHIADRILVLHDGRLEETGSTAEVLGNPQSDYTRQLIEAASL